MKRTILMAALTGAAVLLAGCSSTSGTATPATSSSSSAAATSSSAMSSASSSMAPASSASMSPASSASSSEAPASSPESSASSSETASSSLSSSSSGDTSSSSAPPTTTVGDQTEGLDAQTKAWFTTFCEGTEPVLTGAKSLTDMGGSSDSAASEKKLVSLFETLGTTMTKTSAKLKNLPAPTFSGGAAFAGKVVTAYGSAGPQLTAAAKKIAADPSSLQSASGALTTELEKAVAPLQDLGSLKLTAATQAGIEKIPACAAVQKAATG